MFGIFKKESELEKLTRQYKVLLEEAYKLSHQNRTASDQKTMEAEELLLKIEALKLKNPG
jgi:hypothetical protein